MTATHQRRESLVAEVDELLQAGDVGLYEFVWILNAVPELTQSEREAIALDAVGHMLASGRAVLIWKRWDEPKFVDSRTPSLDDVGPEAWQAPTAAPYLAIDEA